MTQKIYKITDLGPGDGGKGKVVHAVSTMIRAFIIIKEGGGQGSHGVTTSRGESHAFSYWGCGTFEGIPTFISPRMVIFPIGILNEAEMLRYQQGIHDPFSLLTVDENTLCSTSFHGIASRLKELARGENPRGTVGIGIGEAYRYSQWFPELDVRMRDLKRKDLKDRLAAVREEIRRDIARIYKGEYLPADRPEAERQNNLLYDDGFLDYVFEQFEKASQLIRVVDAGYLKKILSHDGNIVVESSHGVLTDHYQGFYPHVSAIRTLPCFTEQMLRGAGYNGQIVNIGVTRAYSIRHGAGPMPTDSPKLAEILFPGSHVDYDRYRGKARVGPLDLNLLRYAIEVCGGSTAFDGLAITWFDQVQKNGQWKICDRYLNADDPTFFAPNGAIKVRRGQDKEQLAYQEALGQRLMRCQPEITTIEVPSGAKTEDLFRFCADVLKEKVEVPVRMVSFGPTERDKVCK